MTDFTSVSDNLKKRYLSLHEMKGNDLCNEGNNPLICNDSKKLEKSDWWYLVQTLEKWHVFKPRAIITKYGAFNCWEAMQLTKENRPRVPGAYFTKVVRSLCLT